MALQIAEPRIDSIDELLAFARSCDSTPAVEQVVLALSLAAHQDDELMGAAIFYRNRHDLPCLDVVVAQKDAPAELLQQLVDKALLKLQSSNISKCTLQIPGQDNPHRFWTSVQWDTEVFEVARDTPTDDDQDDDTDSSQAA